MKACGATLFRCARAVAAYVLRYARLMPYIAATPRLCHTLYAIIFSARRCFRRRFFIALLLRCAMLRQRCYSIYATRASAAASRFSRCLMLFHALRYYVVLYDAIAVFCRDIMMRVFRV